MQRSLTVVGAMVEMPYEADIQCSAEKIFDVIIDWFLFFRRQKKVPE